MSSAVQVSPFAAPVLMVNLCIFYSIGFFGGFIIIWGGVTDEI